MQTPIPDGDGIYRRIAFPTRIVWLHFLVNSCLWGAALYAPIVGFFFCIGAIRRTIRRKRGRCPMCAYDLRGLLESGCPECGWNRLGA